MRKLSILAFTFLVSVSLPAISADTAPKKWAELSEAERKDSAKKAVEAFGKLPAEEQYKIMARHQRREEWNKLSDAEKDKIRAERKAKKEAKMKEAAKPSEPAKEPAKAAH